MKKYLFLLMLPLWLLGCEDDSIDDVFDESPERRVAVALESMNNLLTTAEYGWIASYKYNDMQNETYFYLHFKPEGRVVTISGSGSGKVTHESLYSLKYGQQIDMVFDSYSTFADMIQFGGDFRFELREHEGDIIRWNTRGDGNPDLGMLTLTPAPSEAYYDELMTMRERMLSNANKSFYRVMTLNGSDRKYFVTCQANVLFEWVENGKIISEEILMDMDTEGFTLDEPLEVEGKKIIRFLYNEAEDSFDVWDENEKVGVLAYSNEKPFSRPGAVKDFMNKVGATTSTLRIYIIGYSQKMSDEMNALKLARPDFSWMQLQPYNNWAVYNFTKGTAFFRIDVTYGDDEITFDWVGTAEDPFTRSVLDLVRPSMRLFSGVFSIVYRNNAYYFVRNDDPSISFIAKPNALTK